MKELNCFLLCVCLMSSAAQAQTKPIAHKSHGGTAASFAFLEASGAFEAEDADYGQAPDPIVRYAQLDSVIRLSDSVAVMITSHFCRDRMSRNETDLSRWRAGKDTVLNHALFCSKLEVSEIRKRLKGDYYFRNDMSKVVFIGYDNKPKQQKQQTVPIQQQNQQGQNQQQENQFKPSLPDDTPNGGNTPPLWPYLVAVACAALFTGIYASRKAVSAKQELMNG